MLEYRIISSNGFNIYKLKFEGKGESLSAYCNCYSGKNGKYCKHISNLINNNIDILQPSDNIELLKDVIKNSSIISRNKDYLSEIEKNWFVYNDKNIYNIDDLYNYLLNTINENMIIENNKEMKRLAVYKAEYYKNGNPKFILKNRILCMEYNNDLTNINLENNNYKYFANAGLDFIESIKKIENNNFENIGIYAFKALFSDGYTTGPFISKYNDLDMICNRAVVLLLFHTGYNGIKEKIFIKNIFEIQMNSENDQSYYEVPHKIIKTYDENDIEKIINRKIIEIENG